MHTPRALTVLSLSLSPPVFDQLDLVTYEEVVKLPAFKRKTLVLLGESRSAQQRDTVTSGRPRWPKSHEHFPTFWFFWFWFFQLKSSDQLFACNVFFLHAFIQNGGLAGVKSQINFIPKWRFSSLFWAVVAVIFMLTIKQQLGNYSLSLEARNGRRLGHSCLYPLMMPQSCRWRHLEEFSIPEWEQNLCLKRQSFINLCGLLEGFMAPDKVAPIPCIMCVANVLFWLASCAEPAPVPPCLQSSRHSQTQ